jgi:sugar lactone lactonase YvrE
MYVCMCVCMRPMYPAASTIAGSGTNARAAWEDGTGTITIFSFPVGMAIDACTGIIYTGDTQNHRIRKVTAAGVVSTLAGGGGSSGPTQGNFTDGAGTNARFNNPRGLAIDDSGNVWVADTQNHRIRKVTAAGQVTTVAGRGNADWADGVGSNAAFNSPYDVDLDSSNNLIIADRNNHRLRKITPFGVVTTIAGGGLASWVDGLGMSATFNNPSGVVVDHSSNTIYVADTSNNIIRKVSPSGQVSTLAGGGTVPNLISDVVIGSNARFVGPSALDIDVSGNILVTDEQNQYIRQVTAAKLVTTIAGNGVASFADGAFNASFNNPAGIVTWHNVVYVADQNNHRIRMLTMAGGLSLCPINMYGPVGSAACVACSPGKFCPAGAVTPSNCPVGFYCPANFVVDALPRACAPGQYCNTAGLSAGFSCSTGTVNPWTGMTSSSACTPCTAGTYAPAAGLSGCVVCGAGAYCPSATSQIACPAGRFNPVTGLSAVSACMPCAASLWASPDQLACVSVCPAGSFLNATTAQCVPCVGGRFCLGGASPALICPEGLYCPLGASYPVVCPSGSYCSAGAIAPTLCPPAVPLSNVAATSLSACQSYGM